MWLVIQFNEPKARKTWRVHQVGTKNTNEKLTAFPLHLFRADLNSSSNKTCKLSPEQKSLLLVDIHSTHLTTESHIKKSSYHGG